MRRLQRRLRSYSPRLLPPNRRKRAQEIKSARRRVTFKKAVATAVATAFPCWVIPSLSSINVRRTLLPAGRLWFPRLPNNHGPAIGMTFVSPRSSRAFFMHQKRLSMPGLSCFPYTPREWIQVSIRRKTAHWSGLPLKYSIQGFEQRRAELVPKKGHSRLVISGLILLGR